MVAVADDNMICRRRGWADSRRLGGLGVLGGENRFSSPSVSAPISLTSSSGGGSYASFSPITASTSPSGNSGINYAALVANAVSSGSSPSLGGGSYVSGSNSIALNPGNSGSSSYQMPMASLPQTDTSAYGGLASSLGSGSYGALSSQAAATTLTSSQAQVLSSIQSMGNASPGQPNGSGASLGASTEINFNNQETITNAYSSGMIQSEQYQMTPGGLQTLRPDNGVAGFMWNASFYIPVAGPAMHAIGDAIQGQWGQAALNTAFAVADVTPFGEAGADAAKAAELAGERLATETSGTVGALEDWTNVNFEARLAARDNAWETDNAIHIHGNSAMSPRTAYLYGLYDKESNQLLKWGISQNPATRYSKSFMLDKRIEEITSGSRSEMLQMERNFVETQPGPLNYEPWAGSQAGGQQ